jgi:hypothetical protein
MCLKVLFEEVLFVLTIQRGKYLDEFVGIIFTKMITKYIQDNRVHPHLKKLVSINLYLTDLAPSYGLHNLYTLLSMQV